jgi:hypothetical protein
MILVLLLLLALPLTASEAVPDSIPEIRDPLFEILVNFADGDSVGVWTGDELRQRVETTGRKSNMPMHFLKYIERVKLHPDNAPTREGYRAWRQWQIVITGKLTMPLPYSILGYNPGSMHISKELILTEWHLGGPTLYLPVEDGTRKVRCSDLKVFRIDEGFVGLDVDGWLDRLLGKLLDDTWNTGFLIGNAEGDRIILAQGYSKKMRPIFGEFDPKTDKVKVHGSPLARGLSTYVRKWSNPDEDGNIVWGVEF